MLPVRETDPETFLQPVQESVLELNPEVVVESDPKQVMEFFLKLLQKEVPLSLIHI